MIILVFKFLKVLGVGFISNSASVSMCDRHTCGMCVCVFEQDRGGEGDGEWSERG